MKPGFLLHDFGRLSAGRKIRTALVFLACWVPLDYAAHLFSKNNLLCSWYPNTGLAVGFLAYFGWPAVFLELAGRLLMASLLWEVKLGPLTFLSYVALPALLSYLVSVPIRRAISFEGRASGARVAATLMAVAFGGAFFRSFLIQLANILTGVFPEKDFLSNLLYWAAGDLIGLITLAPLAILVLGPWLAGERPRLTGNPKFASLLLLAFALLLALLLYCVPERHYMFWHLVVGIHLVGAWKLGFRWMTLQVALVNFSLSFLEYFHPSHVFPLEQQSFLAVLTGAALYLAGLFEEQAANYRNFEKLSHELIHAAEEKQEFRNMLSHELRTPMAVILGYGDLKEKNPPAFLASEGPEKIRSSARALHRILSRLVLLGNPEGAWEKSEIKRVNLVPLLEEAVEKWSVEAKKKNLSLVWEPPSAPVEASVIAEGARLILDELLDNAVKFTERGFIKVKASVQNDKVNVAVEDSGSGIAPHFPLFRTFEQESGGLSRPRGGLGIGLSLCRMLIEPMGGRVYLAWSEPGKGSRFVAEFPASS
jgi:signal transduction histidine kinase